VLVLEKPASICGPETVTMALNKRLQQSSSRLPRPGNATPYFVRTVERHSPAQSLTGSALQDQEARTRALNTILDGIAASRRRSGLSSDYRDLGWLLHMRWNVDLSEAEEIAKAWAAARRASRRGTPRPLPRDGRKSQSNGGLRQIIDRQI
jgi:hypothetical protein